MQHGRLAPIVAVACLFLAIAGSVQAASGLPYREANLHPATPDSEAEINAAAGKLYVSDHAADEIWVIDPDSGSYTIYGADSPSDAKPDMEGDIWWTDEGTILGRIDTGTNKVTTWPIGGVGSANMWGLDVDAAGKIWITEWFSGSIRKFDPSTSQFCTYPVPGGSTSYYIRYQDPYLWLINWGNDRVFRLDPTAPSRQLRSWQIPGPPNPMPRGLAVDAAGKLWWADAGMHALARLDPATDGMTAYALPVGTSPQWVYPQDGKVWYTESGLGSFGILDPAATGGITTTLITSTETVVADCGDPVTGTTVSLTPSYGSLSWSSNTMAVLRGDASWQIYQFPAGGKAYAIAPGGKEWWLTDIGRRKLVRLGARFEIFLPMVACKRAAE